MGLFNFFSSNKREFLQTGPDFVERKGPFGERVRKGQYRQAVEKGNSIKGSPRGIFGLFGGGDEKPQIKGKKAK